MIESLGKLANTIKFNKKKSQHKKPMPNMLFFGEMGNGKSTTANKLMKILAPEKELKKSDTFLSGKSG